MLSAGGSFLASGLLAKACLRPHLKISHSQTLSSFKSSCFPKGSVSSRRSATSQGGNDKSDESEVKLAWCEALKRRTRARDNALTRRKLPKEVFEVTFSQSSGPGGQNVNKVSTKASIRMLLGPSSKSKDYDRSSPVPLPIPKPILFSIVSDSSQPQPYYATSTNSLLITSSEYRTQGENLENATKKLVTHLQKLATQGIVGTTSPQQREKVQKLADREKRKMREIKARRSSVKAGRSKVDW